MSAILRGVMSRSAPVLKANVTHKATLVSGPPRVKISFAEKATTGVFMAIAIMAPAGYVMANILNYRKRAGDDSLGE